MNKKEHILDVAEALFNEFGYAAVGVDLIRDSAEVSKTSMYRYFGSKNNLIEAVLQRRHKRFADALGAVAASSADAESRLNAILNWHFAWFKEESFKGCMFMHALAEFKRQDDVLTNVALEHKRWLKNLLGSIFPTDQASVQDKAEALLTLIEGMIVRAEFEDVAKYKNIYRITAKNIMTAVM